MKGVIGVSLALAMATSATAHDCDPVTARDRTIVTAFAHRCYDERDPKGAFERWVSPDSIPHNPGIAEGRDAAFAPMFARPGSRFDGKRVVVDGGIAVIHLHGRRGDSGAGGAVADIYRLANGRIVEHWDVLQSMPTSSANPHPLS